MALQMSQNTGKVMKAGKIIQMTIFFSILMLKWAHKYLLQMYIVRGKSILDCENIIKSRYPLFQRSKKFKEFDKYIRKSQAKYLLKYDRVKVVEGGFFRKTVKMYSIDNIEADFPDMPKAFVSCIRLKSLQRKQSRISARINRYKKYYEKPTELFARLVEGLYIDKEWVEAIAPNVTRQFFDLLHDGYYLELKLIVEKLNG